MSKRLTQVLLNSPLRRSVDAYTASDPEWAKLRVGHHLEPGIVTYDDTDGDGKPTGKQTTFLLTWEAIAKMRPTAEGIPLVGRSGGYDHRKVNPSDFRDGEADGVVVRSFVNPDPQCGWEDVEFMVWDEDTKRKIDEGYQLSCAYFPTETKDEPGLWHNSKYDAVILDGRYTHVAVVPNPRYNGAEIYNSKNGGIVDRVIRAMLSVVPLVKLRELVNAMELEEKNESDAIKISQLSDLREKIKTATPEERVKLALEADALEKELSRHVGDLPGENASPEPKPTPDAPAPASAAAKPSPDAPVPAPAKNAEPEPAPASAPKEITSADLPPPAKNAEQAPAPDGPTQRKVTEDAPHGDAPKLPLGGGDVVLEPSLAAAGISVAQPSSVAAKNSEPAKEPTPAKNSSPIPMGGKLLRVKQLPKDQEFEIILVGDIKQGASPFATWTREKKSGGCTSGHYFQTESDAIGDFEARNDLGKVHEPIKNAESDKKEPTLMKNSLGVCPSCCGEVSVASGFATCRSCGAVAPASELGNSLSTSCVVCGHGSGRHDEFGCQESDCFCVLEHRNAVTADKSVAARRRWDSTSRKLRPALLNSLVRVRPGDSPLQVWERRSFDELPPEYRRALEVR